LDFLLAEPLAFNDASEMYFCTIPPTLTAKTGVRFPLRTPTKSKT